MVLKHDGCTYVHAFSMLSMMHGYHVYRSIWNAASDGNFVLAKEVESPHNFARY